MVVDRRLYGASIANWQPGDYRPDPHPAFFAYLAALRPGVLRWPSGHSSQEYIWEGGGPGQSGDYVLTADHVDDFIALCQAVGAEPMIGINVKTSTPAAAAADTAP